MTHPTRGAAAPGGAATITACPLSEVRKATFLSPHDRKATFLTSDDRKATEL